MFAITASSEGVITVLGSSAFSCQLTGRRSYHRLSVCSLLCGCGKYNTLCVRNWLSLIFVTVGDTDQGLMCHPYPRAENKLIKSFTVTVRISQTTSNLYKTGKCLYDLCIAYIIKYIINTITVEFWIPFLPNGVKSRRSGLAFWIFKHVQYKYKIKGQSKLILNK